MDPVRLGGLARSRAGLVIALFACNRGETEASDGSTGVDGTHTTSHDVSDADTNDDDACPDNPNFRCPPQECTDDCGPLAPFDASGCRRSSCEVDTDCPEGFGCYDPPLSGCYPSHVDCEVRNGRCDCDFSGDCLGKYCIDQALLGTDPNWPPGGDVIAICDAGVAQAPLDIQDAEVNAGSGEAFLNVTMNYAGSCVVHRFSLCWDGEFSATEPAEARIVIAHDANEDACEDPVLEARTFDLRPLAQAYTARSGIDAGVIHLQLQGWDDTLVFEFGT